MGTQVPTNWNYLKKILYCNRNNHSEDHKVFTRSTDASGKAITVYEFKYTLSKLYEAFGLEKFDGPFLMKFALLQYSAGRQSIGRMLFHDKMTDDEKISKMIAYGWCPSNLPHVMQLYDTKAEMNADIAEFDKNNQPPVTTDPPVTTEVPDTTVPLVPMPPETTPIDTPVTTEPPYVEYPCPVPPDTTIYNVEVTPPVGGGDFESAIFTKTDDDGDAINAIQIECAESPAVGAAILAMIAIGSAAIVVKKKH